MTYYSRRSRRQSGGGKKKKLSKEEEEQKRKEAERRRRREQRRSREKAQKERSSKYAHLSKEERRELSMQRLSKFLDKDEKRKEKEREAALKAIKEAKEKEAREEQEKEQRRARKKADREAEKEKARELQKQMHIEDILDSRERARRLEEAEEVRRGLEEAKERIQSRARDSGNINVYRPYDSSKWDPCDLAYMKLTDLRNLARAKGVTILKNGLQVSLKDASRYQLVKALKGLPCDGGGSLFETQSDYDLSTDEGRKQYRLWRKNEVF